MINIKFIPNILVEAGRLTRPVEFHYGNSIRDYVQMAGFNPEGYKIIVSGKEEKLLDHLCNDNDEIIITPRIKAWAFFAGAKGGMLAYLVGVAKFVAVAYSVITAVRGTRKPSTGSMSGGIEEGSQTYSWDGISTAQDVGIPVAIIYGRHKVGGNILNAFLRYDGDKSYLNVLVGLGEGTISAINSVKLNDQPIANFPDVTVTTRLGTNAQTVISNFNDTHNFYDKNTELAKDSASVYTTIDDDVTGIDLHFLCNNGLYQSNAAGAILENSVTYRVEYKLHAASSYTDLGTTTITAKSRTTLRRVHSITGLTPGQYDVRVTKTSNDSTLDPLTESDFTWSQVDEIKDDSFAYPNTALLAIEALATDQLSGTIPNITCVVDGVLVNCPRVMNGAADVAWEDYHWNATEEEYQLISDNTPLTWDGTTYTAQWTRNPIWLMKDLIINSRYGLGEFIDSSLVDDEYLVDMAQHCEELVPNGSGGYEKRFCLDVVIDSLSSALDLITQLSASFSGFGFYSEGSVKIGIDKTEDYVQLFNMGRIRKGTFRQSWKSLKEVPNVIEAQFLDADKDYEQETIAYIDEDSLGAGDPMRKQSVRLFCTKMSQALRIARQMAKGAKYLTRSYTFGVGMEAIACQVGNVVAIAHDLPQWAVRSGNIIAGTTNTFTIDEPVTIEDGKSYVVLIQHQDDTFEQKTIVATPGVYTSLPISGSFDATPAAYDRYAIYQSTQQIKKVRILQMRKNENYDIELTAVDYDARVYDDSDITLPENNYSVLSLDVPSITDLKLTEAAVESADGKLNIGIDVWFAKPQDANKVRKFKGGRIYISEDGNHWEFRKEIVGTHYQIISDVILNKEYYIKVTTVSHDNAESSFSDAPSQAITLTGASAQPADVSAFIVIQSRDRLELKWTKVSSPGVWYYEIRYGGSSWDTSRLLKTINADGFITTSFSAGSNQKFFIKVRSLLGLYSDAATEGVVTVDSIPFENIISEFQEHTAWAGTLSNLTKVGNNLEVSTGQLSGTYVTPVRDIGYVATFAVKTAITTAVSHTLALDSSATARLDSDPTLRLSGYDIPGASTLEIRYSEDNTTWTAYQEFIQGDYKFRYFQLRLTLTRTDTDVDLECSAMDYYVDLPDVDDRGTGTVSTAADGAEISFVKTYHVTPQMDIQINSGTGIYWKVTASDTTGFTVKLYDSTGTLVTGDFCWKSHGI